MQHGIDDGSASAGLGGKRRIATRPSGYEPLVVGPAAVAAGTMPGREGGGLVEEKQLGPFASGHDPTRGPVPPLQRAGDPSLEGVGADNPLGVVMDDAAVAGQRAPFRCGDDAPEGIYPVLERHQPR